MVVVVYSGFLHGPNYGEHTLKYKNDLELDERQQRRSIAWCGRCGNISVDGINFERIDAESLQCLACGAVSPHFEYLRRSSLIKEGIPLKG